MGDLWEKIRREDFVGVPTNCVSKIRLTICNFSDIRNFAGKTPTRPATAT